MAEEEIKIAAWAKKTGKGYGPSKPQNINGVEYWVNLYDNRDNKSSPASPDFNIILKKAAPKNNAAF